MNRRNLLKMFCGAVAGVVGAPFAARSVKGTLTLAAEGLAEPIVMECDVSQEQYESPFRVVPVYLDESGTWREIPRSPSTYSAEKTKYAIYRINGDYS